MKPIIHCDTCGFEFMLTGLHHREEFMLLKNKQTKITIQYFTCPKCKEVYIVSIEDDHVKALIEKYKEFLNHPEKLSESNFLKQAEKLRNQISAEESMLHHIYSRQKEKLS